MTHARKSFALSLAFHALMGSLAFWVFTHTHQPPRIERIPFKIMSFQPSEQRVAVPIPPTVPTPVKPPLPPEEVPTPLQSVSKPMAEHAPAPVSKSQSEPEVHAVQPAVPASVSKPLQAPIPAAAPAPVTAPKLETKPDSSAAKKAFFSSLRSTIQNHLRYPTAARRRGMEGEVGVRFTLSANGEINAVSVQRGEGIFHNTALAAVNAASGIDIPKNLMESLPMEIELTLEFKLNR